MKTLAPGITAEESKDKGTIYMVFWPRTGRVLFIFFMLIYIYLMYGLTPKGEYARTVTFLDLALFYLVFLALFSPMLYVAISMWLNKTIFEITKDKIVMRYKLPYWFRKKRSLSPSVTGFTYTTTKFMNKGMAYTLFSIVYIENGKENSFTDVYFSTEVIEVTKFLNENLKRLRVAGHFE